MTPHLVHIPLLPTDKDKLYKTVPESPKDGGVQALVLRLQAGVHSHGTAIAISQEDITRMNTSNWLWKWKGGWQKVIPWASLRAAGVLASRAPLFQDPAEL